MAYPDFAKVRSLDAKVFKKTGGQAALTLDSLANAAARQSAKLDLGISRAPRYIVTASLEFATAPSAGNSVDLYWAPSNDPTAGTDNPGGISGADAAYTGYSSNLAASLKQLQYVGSFICTNQATTTVQRSYCGQFTPALRYGSLIVVNNSGVALVASPTNLAVSLTPIVDVIEDI